MVHSLERQNPFIAFIEFIEFIGFVEFCVNRPCPLTGLTPHATVRYDHKPFLKGKVRPRLRAGLRFLCPLNGPIECSSCRQFQVIRELACHKVLLPHADLLVHIVGECSSTSLNRDGIDDSGDAVPSSVDERRPLNSSA